MYFSIQNYTRLNNIYITVFRHVNFQYNNMAEYGKFIPTQKRGIQLEYQHFIYNKLRTNKDNSIYWECRRRRLEEQCTVHIKSDQNGRILTAPDREHHHENEEQGNEVRNVRANILQQAEQRPEAAPAILINENVGLRLAIEFPSERAMKRAIERRRSRLMPTNPATALDVKIENEWANTLDGEAFLLVDRIVIEKDREGNEHQERVLAFSILENLRELSVHYVFMYLLFSNISQICIFDLTEFKSVAYGWHVFCGTALFFPAIRGPRTDHGEALSIGIHFVNTKNAKCIYSSIFFTS